jgi:capsular exopolysaccharide synthesis family protein
MSRVFEALQKANAEGAGAAAPVPAPIEGPELLQSPAAQPRPGVQPGNFDACPTFHISANGASRLVAFTDQDSAGAESVRVLSTRLRHLRRKRPLSKVLVTSCMQGEGKSVLASNLAVSLARHNQARTLLIDGDLRRPAVHRLLGLEGENGGIEAWWNSGAAPEEVLRRVDDMPLWFLPAGKVVAQPLEILQSARFAELLNQLAPRFEWVIVDSPPVLPMADSSIWATLTDGSVFVVRESHTLATVLKKTLDEFDKSKLIGVVLNATPTALHRGYDKYYFG